MCDYAIRDYGNTLAEESCPLVDDACDGSRNCCGGLYLKWAKESTKENAQAVLNYIIKKEAEYMSTTGRAPLRIRFVVFEGALAMQILEQPEEWREQENYVASNGIIVRMKEAGPQIDVPFIHLRGWCGDKDRRVVVADPVDPAALRDKYIAAISEFVSHMDGEKAVDVSGLVDRLEDEVVEGDNPSSQGYDNGINRAIHIVRSWAARQQTSSPTVSNDVWEW